ncbi:MAG: response regulator, partial [Betaproteobacteria bacterium]
MSGRILVVDDQRAIAEMMTGVLQGRGYEVLTAFDGETALRQVHAERPDLVVSDILMPGMDGYELCRRVRSDPLTALLPIVLVTSLDPQAERINGLEAGADDFLSKPVNWDELFARVKSLLRVKRLQDEVTSWNMELEGRVRDQVSELERLSRLKRF